MVASPVRILIIIPTFNEAESITEILPRALTALPSADVLVVDDSSPDGTSDIVRGMQPLNPRIHLMVRAEKAGLGPAYKAGFAWGLERGYDRLIEMDADGSHPAEKLPDMIEASKHAGLVIGSRYIPGGEVKDWPARRVLLSRWGNRYVGMMLALGVKDSTAGFRVFAAETLRAVDLNEVRANGYGFQIDMTRHVVNAGIKVVEIPITFRDRERGTSKMSAKIVREALTLTTWWGLQRLFTRTRDQRGIKRSGGRRANP
jgi:dolichol-phosphate mannosyltransferase